MNFKWWPIRRFVQLSAVVLIASPLMGLNIFRGNLAGGELFGFSLIDPLAFLQATVASRIFVAPFLGAALVVAAFYFLLGGRTFCAWVCPVGLITELNDRLRRSLATGERRLPLSASRWSLVVVIVVSFLAGVPLFEIISPIGMTTRALMFRDWLTLLMLVSICAVEVALARRVWCRSLCPLGGFYSLLGRFSPLRIHFSEQLCTHCGECTRICPHEEVLLPSLDHDCSHIYSGDCTRCCDCIDICPTKALSVHVIYK